MDLITVTKKNCWQACIRTWKTLIRMANDNRGNVPGKWLAVEVAGYDICEYSCPMCQVYCNGMPKENQCVGCPIAHRYNMQYACEFASEYGIFREHNGKRVEDAERFLSELKEIRRLDKLGLIDYTHKLNPPPN